MNAQDIEKLESRIRDECGFSVHLAAEIEMAFALEGDVPDAFWQALLDAAMADEIALESIGREQTGQPTIQQYECRFAHGTVMAAVEGLDSLNVRLNELAEQFDIKTVSQKNLNDYSIYNGLHWHLHLLGAEEGQYCFFKQEEEMSAPLSDVLGGLLFTMPSLMPCFAPDESSYLRYASGADHVPSRICWGNNNRTAALRLPESVIPLRHIEHRVCGADADPFEAVWALLVGIHYGLTHHPDPGEQCFGDARRAGDRYEAFPLTLEIAHARMEEAGWVKSYLA